MSRLLVPLAVAASLAACSATPPAEEPTPTTSTSTTAPAPTNALSGRPGSNGPVLVVKIDDTPSAHPQIGLESADVVYVEQVEGGLTRLAAVFSSQLPERVGPVRSARISDIDIFANYGKVAFAYSGAQSRLLPVIAAANWIDLGAQRQSPTIYTRDSSRRAPWNMVLLPAKLLEKAAERGLVPVNAASVGWNFGTADAGGTLVDRVEVSWPATKYRVEWTGSQYQMEQDGRLEVAEGGSLLSPSTVVIQLTSIAPSIYKDRHGGVTPKTEVVGSGSALVLRDGYGYRVRWSRASATSPTIFTRPDGEELRFAPGQVWVFLADSTRKVEVTTRLQGPVPAAAPSKGP